MCTLNHDFKQRASQVENNHRLSALIGLWTEANTTLRDAVHFRWSVTVTFVTVMAAICYAVSEASNVSTIACGASAIGCALAGSVQMWWQWSFHEVVVRAQREGARLKREIDTLMSGDPVAPTPVQVVESRDLRDGLVGLGLVSILAGGAAIGWLLMLSSSVR